MSAMRSVSMPVSKPLNPHGWPVNIGGGLVASEIAQSCPTLCNPMDCSQPGSSVHGVLQPRILEWVPFPSPGDLPNTGIEPGSPALQADSFPTEP